MSRGAIPEHLQGIMQRMYLRDSGWLIAVEKFHHHFHHAGWAEQQVVIRFWVLAVVFAMLALVSIKLR